MMKRVLLFLLAQHKSAAYLDKDRYSPLLRNVEHHISSPSPSPAA